jgi:hypothetical protein
MDAVQAVGLAAAAFAAGAINAVAGGGSLVSFPALVAAGYPSKVANVTNSVAMWPGYVGGSIGYRKELSLQLRAVTLLASPSILGAIAGSAILLATPARAFDVVVPFLIVAACCLMALQDSLARWAAHHRLGGDGVSPVMMAGTFVLAIYGAYFGAGLGIMLLAALGILMPDDPQHSNALKGMLSLMINAAAVVYFAAFGPVEWAPAAVMAAGAVAGGYLGVGVARRLGKRWLRGTVIAYGLVSAAVLFARL